MARQSAALFAVLVAGLAVFSAAQQPFEADCRLEVITRDYAPEMNRMPGFDVHCMREHALNGIANEIAYEMAGWNDESNVMQEWGRDALLTGQLRVHVRGNLDARGRVVANFVQLQSHPLESGVPPGLVDAGQEHPSNNGQGHSADGSRRLRGTSPADSLQSPNRGRSLAAFISQMDTRTHDVVTLLIRFDDAAPTRTLAAQKTLQFRTDADSMYHRMNRISYGKVKYLDGNAYEVLIPRSITFNGLGCDYSVWANDADSIFQAATGISASSYRYRMYHIPPGNTCNWIARGSLCSGGCGSGRSWYVAFPNGGGSDWTSRTDTHLHELGHNAGMHHAGVGTNEYADTSCLMGYASTAMKGFNPPHQWYLGFYKDQTYTMEESVTSSALLTIHSVTRYVPGDNKVHIVEVVPSSGAIGTWTGNLFIGFMRQEDFQSGTTYGNKVTISQWDIPTSSTRITWHVAALAANQEFTEGSFSVKVNSIDLAAGSAEVFISFIADQCPDDPNKLEPGFCGCNFPETDSDNDGTPDCVDNCDNDAGKTEPGVCGCGVADTDSDNDGTPDCVDNCANDAAKTEPGQCGCGVAEDTADDDSDLVINCLDGCPADGQKSEPGVCGCGVVEDTADDDQDGVVNCVDQCPGSPDVDSDGDGVLDCNDGCPNDQFKTSPGTCGCGNGDIDSDGDGTLDCEDACINDPFKIIEGTCGCNNPDAGCGNGVCEANEDCNSCPADCATVEIGRGKKSTTLCCGSNADGCDSGCGACIDIDSTAETTLFCSCLQDYTGTGCTSGGGGGGGGGGCTLGQKNDACSSNADCCSGDCNTGRGVCK